VVENARQGFGGGGLWDGPVLGGPLVAGEVDEWNQLTWLTLRFGSTSRSGVEVVVLCSASLTRSYWRNGQPLTGTRRVANLAGPANRSVANESCCVVGCGRTRNRDQLSVRSKVRQEVSAQAARNQTDLCRDCPCSWLMR
jgi:hypothetical protein